MELFDCSVSLSLLELLKNFNRSPKMMKDAEGEEEECVAYEYDKYRIEFGMKCDFQDVPAHVIHHTRSSKTNKKCRRKISERITFSTSDFKEMSSAGTSHPLPSHQSMTHQEGGWTTRSENHEEFRNAAKRSCVTGLGDVLPSLLFAAQTNRATDMLEEYFRGEDSVKCDIPEVHEVAKFTDPKKNRRSVSNVSWDRGGTRFATTYCSLQFEVQLRSENQSTSYIFDVERPDLGSIDRLRPPSPLLCLDFHHTQSNLVVGGCYNGLVTLFDLRRGQIPP